MATIKSFEDIEAWKKARDIAQEIYELTIANPFSVDYSLKNQINASIGSVMDNISEGFERGGTKEFLLFLSYAKGSAGEVRSQLYRAADRHHITLDQFEKLKESIIVVSKMLTGLMTYLQQTTFKGTKFKEPVSDYTIVFPEDITLDFDSELSTLNFQL